MTEVTQVLSAMERGDAQAGRELLPLVYQELRVLAAQKLSLEKPGQTLQPTALVHEAYLRLVDQEQSWANRSHFFAAAAEAMRRILVDNARRKLAVKHGGGRQKLDLLDADVAVKPPPAEILALDAALTRLAADDSEAARIVQLHYFAGQSIEDAAEMLGISRATAYRQWSFARAWLRSEIGGISESADL